MGKNNTIIKQWLSDEGRMASLINGCLFSGKQIFKKEHLKREDGVQGVILRTEDGRETVIERYRDLAISYTEQIRELQKIHRARKDLRGSAEFLSGMKKEELLSPVVSVVFYYGEEAWNGKLDLHGLLGLDREEYRFLKNYVPNYRVNIINPAEIEDLSSLEESLQMVFGMLKYRKDLRGLKTYVEKNREYFSDIDEESYRAAKMMLGAESYWKDIKSKKENGGMDMCKALEDLRQEGIVIGIERGMKLGEERGVEQGVEIGVTRFIEAFQEMGMSYEDTVRKLQEKFGLTEENAEQKMKECWKIV